MQSDWRGPLWAGESSEEAFGDLGQGTVTLHLEGDGGRGEKGRIDRIWGHVDGGVEEESQGQ